METDRIRATYLLRTAGDAAQVAETVAGEQSSGTFVRLAGESAALRDRAAARVERLHEVADSGLPPLPGCRPGAMRSFEMELSWPLETIGASLPNLMATVPGNLFELKDVAGLKLTGLALPDAFLAPQPGPAFGVEGTRQLSGVPRGPLIGTIIKPSVGLSPQETAALVQELAEGGIDFIKDDELQADGPACPFDDRVRAVLAVLDRHAARTGKRVMYAANLTGDIDEMRRRHDMLESLGGTCAMLSLNSVGMAGVLAFRRHSTLPIHAHRNGWGYLGRSVDNGWSYPAWSMLWRMAGVDHMHVNGPDNKFWEGDDSVIASARALLTPLSGSRSMAAMPVFSSGQTVRQAHGTWQRLGSADLIHCAGGGIIGHPAGTRGGVQAFRDAWDAAQSGSPLTEAAQRSPMLAQAMEAFR
ncbi:ribulose-bisphosphate carboxylase large subunit family protein [Sagittula sp. S175]|uniref:ribulose-bisphosphate carboxylase large subunit family protein n=1 Tax=Sagittula sp. S175 TaxID=3415129 RepID=UPI003C7D1A69